MDTPQPTGPSSQERALRVLLADDNRDAVFLLARLLRAKGHEVCTAYDGQEACQAAATFRPDVALLDIGMPRLNGYETARRLRQEPWGRDILLVAITGWGQDEDRRRSMEAGFDQHLLKPVDPKVLLHLLAGVPKN